MVTAGVVMALMVARGDTSTSFRRKGMVCFDDVADDEARAGMGTVLMRSIPLVFGIAFQMLAYFTLGSLETLTMAYWARHHNISLRYMRKRPHMKETT